MKDRHSCCRCSHFATWYYMPSYEGKNEDKCYYCDDHVSRGCSCQVIDYGTPGATEEHKDEQGRLLPCIEYDYNEDGYDVE